MATAPADLTTRSTDVPSDMVVSPRRVLVGIVVVVGLLNIANAIAIASGADTEHTRYWLLALEWNPSSWFSSALLAVTAGTAFVVGRDGDARRWNTVAALLLVMSIDEIATLHERMAALPVVPGIGTRGWAGAGLVLVAIVGVRLVPWALTLDRALRRALVFGGVVFVAGAVGFEVLSGNRAATVGQDGLHWVLATIEEDLELLGVVIVLRALLGRLGTTGAAVRLRVSA